MTDPTPTHKHVKHKVESMRCPEKLYARLNVKHGLEDVGLDEWKRKKKKRLPRRMNDSQVTSNGVSEVLVGKPDVTLSDTAAENETHLLSTNSSPAAERKSKVRRMLESARFRSPYEENLFDESRGLDPDYDYETLEKIETATEKYLNRTEEDAKGKPIEPEVVAIADRLVAFARARREDQERWNLFTHATAPTRISRDLSVANPERNRA